MTKRGVETTAHDTNIDHSAVVCGYIVHIQPLSNILRRLDGASRQKSYIPVYGAATTTGFKGNYK